MQYISYMNIASYSYMCELCMYLASYKGLQNAVCLGCPSILVIIPPRIVLHAQIIKLRALLVVRKIVSWQILCVDKCVCVWFIYFICVYTHGLIPCMFFAFAHTAHMRMTHVYHLSCGWFVSYVDWLNYVHSNVCTSISLVLYSHQHMNHYNNENNLPLTTYILWLHMYRMQHFIQVITQFFNRPSYNHLQLGSYSLAPTATCTHLLKVLHAHSFVNASYITIAICTQLYYKLLIKQN